MAGPALTRATTPSPLGDIVVITDADEVLYGLDFARNEGRLSRLVGRYWPRARVTDSVAPAGIVRALAAYFGGEVNALEALAAAVGGTSFQQQVWAALREIPAGSACSYADLARRIGKPRAVRAVGQANSANPVSLVQPCHRVVAADGRLGGYAGGADRKRWLLAHEGVSVRD